MVSILLFKLGLWDGLMVPSLGMTMEQTGLSSSERTFICSSSIFFICFMIWINFHHKTGRVGRWPTEPLFFSFMAFSYFTPALPVAKIREMYPEADGNYMGFKRKGAEEKMSWKFSYTWNSAICMKYILVWIPSVGRMTELMDSLSSSDDRIGGFPQQVGCWNCQKVDSLSRSEDRIDGFPQQL